MSIDDQIRDMGAHVGRMIGTEIKALKDLFDEQKTRLADRVDDLATDTRQRLAEFGDRIKAEIDSYRAQALLDVEKTIGLLKEKIASLKDGEPGEKGDQGLKGDPGLDGSNGRDGLDGKDGINGIDGKDGRDGNHGRDGIDGNDGADGAPGKDGTNGIDGKDGTNGIDGKDGAPGKDGIDGVNGKDGIDGMPGKDGLAGKDGLPGKPGVDGAKGEKGEPGYDGRSVDFCDLWKAATVYSVGNMVVKDGSLWIARRQTIGEAPDKMVEKDANRPWALAAQRGRTGDKGEDGRHGTDGKNGLDGRHAPKIIDIRIAGHELVAIDEDGAMLRSDITGLLLELRDEVIRMLPVGEVK
jgi:hypothetical protein